jgi:uncharacterized membrane protein
MDPVKEAPELRVSAESLMHNAREYAETRLNLLILDAQEKAADTAAGMVTGAVLGILGLFLLFFLSIGAAWYIGDATGSPFIGFFSVAGFYAVAGLIVFLARNTIIKMPVANSIIKKITLYEED